VDIEYNTVYQAGPTDGLDLFTDLDFLRDYATELGVTSHEADVSRIGDSRSVTLRLVAPTDEVPSIFKSLVGPEITITDRRSWEPDSAGGYRSPLLVEATAKGRTVTISGLLSLIPDGCASSFTALADVSLKVRFIGGLAKGAVAALGTDSMQYQTKDQGPISLARPNGPSHLINSLERIVAGHRLWAVRVVMTIAVAAVWSRMPRFQGWLDGSWPPRSSVRPWWLAALDRASGSWGDAH